MSPRKDGIRRKGNKSTPVRNFSLFCFICRSECKNEENRCLVDVFLFFIFFTFPYYFLHLHVIFL